MNESRMKNKVEPLRPRFKGQIKVSKPHRMSEIEISDEEREMFERQALSIFTECANSGMSFRDSLVSILISGMDWGLQCSKLNRNLRKDDD